MYHCQNSSIKLTQRPLPLHLAGRERTLLGRRLARELFSYLRNRKVSDMKIERTSNEVIIRFPSYVDTAGLQRLVDYLTYKEATAKSKAKQSDVDALTKEVKAGWWAANRSRLIK